MLPDRVSNPGPLTHEKADDKIYMSIVNKKKKKKKKKKRFVLDNIVLRIQRQEKFHTD